MCFMNVLDSPKENPGKYCFDIFGKHNIKLVTCTITTI